MLARPSTLAPLPVMLGETRWPRGFGASLVAGGTLSAGNQQVVTFLPHLLGSDDGTSGPVAVSAVPDSYSGSFLSHHIVPIIAVAIGWV